MNNRLVIGQAVFADFERKADEKMEYFDRALQEGLFSTATALAVEMPFVTQPLRNSGFIQNSHTEIIHVFRPNLWAQDYAHSINKLDKMSLVTATERAYASADYSYRSSKGLRERLKRLGKTEDEFMNAMRLAALIEAVYYSRIGGLDMGAENNRKADIAIMKRYVNKNSMFERICKKVGVDKNDQLALLQLADTLDLTATLQEIKSNDPYFVRRSELIDMYTKINAEESVKTAATKSEAFLRELFNRILRRKKAEPWLISAIDDVFGA